MKNGDDTTGNWPEVVAEKEARIAELETLVTYYEEQFRLSQHRRFGSQSEQSKYDQISLFDEAEVESDDAVEEPPLREIQKHFRKSRNLSNRDLPENLPIEVVIHRLPKEEQICPSCHSDLHVLGNEKRRELKIIPASVVIVEHRREVYSCRACEENACAVPILTSAIDEPVIKGSFASPEAIAHIINQKFTLAMPLYRQAQEWNRQGIPLSRQTMSNWVLKATNDWLLPVYELLHEELCKQEVLHADETPLQVLHEAEKSTQSKSYMWLYRTGKDSSEPIILYNYCSHRKHKTPAVFLDGFKGYLHTDGYGAYHNLPPEIKVVGCLAHARRRWDEALKALDKKHHDKSLAWRGKQFCDQLFHLEKEWAGLSVPDRQEQRQKVAMPIWAAFYAWIHTLTHLPKTALGRAITYMLNQRQYLENYFLDGRLEISNNLAENAIRPFVIGRKNWLFANTPKGAQGSAIMYSIVETAKANNLDPFHYLTYIFRNAPNWDLRDPQQLHKLLPINAPQWCRTLPVN